MGIRQLQTFIQQSVPNGYIDISLYDECASFNRKTNLRPILVIDLQGILRPLIKCNKELLCGLRHNEIYKNFELLLQKLSTICDLIFFEDGPVNAVKLPEWIRRQNDRLEISQRILDKIYNYWTLEAITTSEKTIPSITSHLKLCEHLAKKYGKLIITIHKECDTEMAQFACRNERVLAILAEDSDFLIYPGQWRYFSLRALNEETLTTKEYNRQALRKCLNLNDEELVLLSTLNGNDVISFYDTYHFHKSLIRQRYDPSQRFPAISEFIRNSQLLQSRNLYADVAYIISPRNARNFVIKVKESIEFYDTNFDVSEIQDRFLRYLYENFHIFIYAVLNYIPRTFTLWYIDLRQIDIYSQRTIYLFQKQIGIILRYKQKVRPYQICTKLTHNDIFRVFHVDPVFPTIFQPPLFELLNRQQFPQHDTIRFNLLKWLICDNKENLQNVNLELIPKNILLDILVLIYMVNEGLACPAEADLVMLSIKHVITATVPENLQTPDILYPRAFFISQLFSKCHMLVGRCLQVTGLKELGKIHNFDSVLFHNLYMKNVNQPFNMPFLLGDVSMYRYYV